MTKLLLRFFTHCFIPSVIFVLYLFLGYWLFIFLLGYAFAGGIAKMVTVLLLAGGFGAFALCIPPALIWKRWSRAMPFAYGAVALIFAFGALGDIGSAKGCRPFLCWFVTAVVIVVCGWVGAVVGRRISSKAKRNPDQQDTASSR